MTDYEAMTNAARNVLNLALEGAEHALRGETQAIGSNVPREAQYQMGLAMQESA